MQTIKTNGRTLVVVEVPAYASDFYISGMGFLCHYKPTRDVVMINGNTSFDVDDDIENYKIIGLLSEYVAEQIMPRYNFQTFRAWLQCKGVDVTKPLLIIEKLK